MSRPTARACLNVVGVTHEELRHAAGSALDGGAAYLVGSLSSGFGNAGSDVDVHVLRHGDALRTGPHLSFVQGVVVDVESFPLAWADQVASAARGRATADIGPGRIALGVPADPVMGWTVLARWLHAVPLESSTPPVFGADDTHALIPLLVRQAFDELVLAVAVARLAEAAEQQPAAVEYLWRHASHCLLELRCRAAGDVTVNRKWLPARAQRLSLPHCDEAVDEAEFRRMAEGTGLVALPEWELTVLFPAADAQVTEVAGRSWLLNRHGRLLDSWCDLSGSTAHLVNVVGARRLFTALRRAELDMAVDDQVLGRMWG